jgi:hypothetical protein
VVDLPLPANLHRVWALSTQLKELRRRYHTDTTTLRKALAVAQGENLALRRKLALYE